MLEWKNKRIGGELEGTWYGEGTAKVGGKIIQSMNFGFLLNILLLGAYVKWWG
jgi:hypothetical protein